MRLNPIPPDQVCRQKLCNPAGNTALTSSVLEVVDGLHNRFRGEEMHTIEQAAAQSGLTVHTLRYYEKVGILPLVGRNAGGHRRYSESDLGWIKFVSLLKATGMPLSDIRAFVAAEKRGAAGHSAKIDVLRRHRARMTAKITEMTSFLEKIDDKISYYGDKS
jgi:DNA-binding transcriptional MerR regulator